MSKSLWMISIMGLVTLLAMAMGMAISLGQFQEAPAMEWVRISEAIGREFKAEQVGVRVNMLKTPTAMVISYSSLVDSKYDLSFQNAEMERVANYAIRNYKGREQTKLEEIRVTRSETHGRGCFRQTYVANLTLSNPLRPTLDRPGYPGTVFDPRHQ